MSFEINYPPELIHSICTHVYTAGLPASIPSLDPLIQSENGIPTSLPSAIPPGSWTEAISRRTLSNLCLVNHAWYDAAKPWLWHKIEVRLPRSWISLVEEIGLDDEISHEQVSPTTGNFVKATADLVLADRSLTSESGTIEKSNGREDKKAMEVLGPDGSIPPELLSPPTSRDPSPRRLRLKSQSPARWKVMRSITDALMDALDRREPGYYVPTPHDPRPGRFVHHLDFNHFRTIGMRRSVEEGVNSRFVTGERIEAVLKEMPSLTVFGATEYMDGALTLPVLKELFLRGAPSCGRGRKRALFMTEEEEERERRAHCKDLEAVDLTGCVSAVFVNALTEFVNAYLLPINQDSSEVSSDNGREERRTRNLICLSQNLPMTAPGLRRLGLRGVKSVLPRILTPFVLSFPSLTHLDLSGTRATPDLLSALGQSPTVRLVSLALARCTKLTGESIRNFLVESPVSSRIRELSLYGDITYSSPLSENDLRDIISDAPSFTSGELVYLDLSSTPLTPSLLELFGPQLNLRSLGLSYIANLPLKAVADFLLNKAKNVEVLTLISTSPELDRGPRAAGPGNVVRQGSIPLHTQIIRPLCTPPFSGFSFSLTTSPPNPPNPPPTRLRVIELSTPMLGALGAGAGAWRIIRSKGGRGWYVDTAAGWVADGEAGSVLRRDLTREHPLRVELERLSSANGNVNSGVGWHARKMEILHGHGMLGREDGLYGAVSFAYQG